MPAAQIDNIQYMYACIHAGPVDAAYKAVDSLVKVEAELTDYSINSVTEVSKCVRQLRCTSQIRSDWAAQVSAYMAGCFREAEPRWGPDDYCD
jgi:hypothetical protein